ncbi:hypothetical protein [Bradyrhizobium sp. 27S5]|uniref:hypothetical protein n=1 Tax=Bradyrhizobium sp. 27S5 TaxID=3139728 RepID=UPI0030D54893
MQTEFVFWMRNFLLSGCRTLTFASERLTYKGSSMLTVGMMMQVVQPKFELTTKRAWD